MKWHGKIVVFTKLLDGECAALKPLQNECWELYFAIMPLGVFDAGRSRIIKPHQNRVYTLFPVSAVNDVPEPTEKLRELYGFPPPRE